MDSEILRALGEHRQFFAHEQLTKEDGSIKSRVKCNLNDMSFPPRADVIKKFIQGKKFEALLKFHKAECSLSQFEPYIIASKNFPTMFYCTLTGQLMEKSVEAARKHQQGKKFNARKDLYDSGLRKLKPEPNLDDVMAEASGKRPKPKKKVDSDGEDEEGEDVGAEDEDEEDEDEKGEDEEEEDRPLKKLKIVEDPEDEDEDGDDVEEVDEDEEEELEAERSSDDFDFDEPEPSPKAKPPAKVVTVIQKLNHQRKPDAKSIAAGKRQQGKPNAHQKKTKKSKGHN